MHTLHGALRFLPPMAAPWWNQPYTVDNSFKGTIGFTALFFILPYIEQNNVYNISNNSEATTPVPLVLADGLVTPMRT